MCIVPAEEHNRSGRDPSPPFAPSPPSRALTNVIISSARSSMSPRCLLLVRAPHSMFSARYAASGNR